MALASTSRWPTVTGLWLGLAAWLYAALAVLELGSLDRDPTRPEPGYVVVPGYVPGLTHLTAAVLALAIGGAAWSLATGRGRRASDAGLAAGLLLGGWFLWAVAEPRPVAPVLVALAAMPLALATVLPTRAPEQSRALPARLLLAVPAVLGAWVCGHELAGYSWRLQAGSFYWLGLAGSAAMLAVALLLPLLTGAAWRWLLGLPVLLLGLLLAVGGVLGLREGWLVSGFEEYEDGWRLGGPILFSGLGVLTAGAAALRGRMPLAAGTLGAATAALLAVVFGIPEVRSGF